MFGSKRLPLLFGFYHRAKQNDRGSLKSLPKEGGGRMSQLSRNIITRKQIEDELYFYNTADIKSTVILCLCLALFFGPLTFGILYFILTETTDTSLKIGLSIPLGILFSAPIWGNLIVLAKHVDKRSLLKKGEYDIVILPVSDKYESSRNRSTVHLLEFPNLKEIAVSSTTYSLASWGDEFYVVHYKGKNKIELLYSLKTHEYREA